MLDIPRFLPDARLVPLRRVAAACASLGMRSYLVGGFVRDALLGRPIGDFDIVIEGDATKVARRLVKEFGGRATVHPKFHTAAWSIPETFDVQPSTLDLVSARSETYEHPAALPTVKLGSLADDLRRRDFTVNAMAVSLDEDRFGELADPLGGRGDLSHGLLRVLHPRSFIDDPTRLFRAVRYAQRYGFRLASETEATVPPALQYVDALSPERLRHELDLILDEDDPVPMLDQLWALGILQAARPALPWDEATRTRFRQGRSLPSNVNRVRLRWALWLLASSEKEIRAFNKRLHFDADLKKTALAASSIFRDLDFFGRARPSECLARLDALPVDAVRAAAVCAPRGRSRANLTMYLEKWKALKPFANGETLKSLGVPPGPRYGEILSRLRAAWVDGEVASEEQETALLNEMLARKSNDI